MRKYGIWALALGMLSATPGLTMADGLFSRILGPRTAASSAPKSRNQRVAEQIAGALRQANLNGYDVRIEYKNGVATLGGSVASAEQRARASQLVSRVAGVNRVNNQLQVGTKPTNQNIQLASGTRSARPQVQTAAFEDDGTRNRQIQQVSGQAKTPNQRVAEQIAGKLAAAGLTGYDVEIRYSKGTARLGGKVGSLEQRAMAEALAAQVPGVNSVDNGLAVSMEPPQPKFGAPISPAAFQQDDFAPPMPDPAGAAANGAPMPVPDGPAPGPAPMGPPPQGYMGPPMMPTPYSHPGAGPAQGMYNMPYMPEHAWPAYAQYPNYSAVTYPQDYSASAWPYIGPFYPYPQVPLGWRKSTLEWDDGHWHLSFNSKTDKWWWFLDPKNWK